MPNLLTWFVGNRSPSISENITTNGVAVDLTGSTVRFQMRQVGSSVLTVDQSAVIVSAPAGTVRYDWSAADVTAIGTTGGTFLVWWQVTTAGKVQDVHEALIEFIPHAPVSKDYVEIEDLKKTLALDGLNYVNLDLKDIISAASRKVDEHTDRRFYADVDAAQVRYYTPDNPWTLGVDDIVTVTTLKTDDGGDGTYENTWTLNTDYVREPLNAAADGQPWTQFCVHPTGAHLFPTGVPRSVEVTGKFGWTAVPPEVKLATKMLAHRYVKRVREAATGVVGFGLDGAVVRVMSVDPDVVELLGPFCRRVFVA